MLLTVPCDWLSKRPSFAWNQCVLFSYGVVCLVRRPQPEFEAQIPVSSLDVKEGQASGRSLDCASSCSRARQLMLALRTVAFLDLCEHALCAVTKKLCPQGVLQGSSHSFPPLVAEGQSMPMTSLFISCGSTYASSTSIPRLLEVPSFPSAMPYPTFHLNPLFTGSATAFFWRFVCIHFFWASYMMYVSAC